MRQVIKNVGVDSLSHIGRIVLILLFISACSSNNGTVVEEDVLAQINDLSVSVDHFESAFKNHFYRTGQVLTPTESTRKAILDSEFNTYVMAVYAQDLGLDKTQEAEYQKLAIEKRVLTEEYFNQVILSEVKATEQDIREYFVRFNTNLRASHIYAPTKEKAEEYFARLNNGEAFEELARDAFTNPYLAENGGDIGRFTTDDLDIAFENAAFDLNVGEVSEPVLTAQGYSIIKLTDRVTRPILTEYEFNQHREKVESYTQKKLEEVAQREHLEKFTNESELDKSVYLRIVELLLSNQQNLLNKETEFLSTLDDDGIILEFENFEFRTNQFIEEILASSVTILNTVQSERGVENFIYGVAYRSYLVEKAKELKIDVQPLVLDSIDETFLHYLEEVAMEKLREDISFSPAELYEYFSVKQDQFVDPLYVRVQRLVVDNEDLANELYEELKQGSDFTEIVTSHTKKNEDRFTNGDLGFIPIDDFGFNSSKIANLQISEISEVISYGLNEFHIYKLIDKQESRALTFDEARESVVDFLTRQKLQELRTNTISDVKTKHNAVVNLDKLNALTIKI